MSTQERECVAEDFEVGETVEMTDRALRQGLQGHARSNRGVVVAVHPPLRIVVRRDGLKTPNPYYAGFWRPATYKGDNK
jgi:hypothetical protein